MLSVTMAGLAAAQKEMNVTSNNMANASTVGFKRSYANFGDVFSSDPAANPNTAVGGGVLTASVSRDTTAGALRTTGRVTDLALDGRGFFVLQDANTPGTYTYSRAGNFGLDANGNMVDPGGNQVVGFGAAPAGVAPNVTYTPTAVQGAVQVPSSYAPGAALPDGTVLPAGAPILLQSMAISPKGEVQGTYSNGQTYTLRFIALATFPNDGGLKSIGTNRFLPTGSSGTANITSGALEQANVDITSELMDMIRAQQVYNGNARILQTTVETVSRLTDKL